MIVVLRKYNDNKHWTLSRNCQHQIGALATLAQSPSAKRAQQA